MKSGTIPEFPHFLHLGDSFAQIPFLATMATFDITQEHDGIVIISGFGDKHWETAAYVNGQLFASDRHGFEDDQPATKLCKHLATLSGHAWREYTTHFGWRLRSWCEVPKSLAEYDAQTLQHFKEMTPESFLDEIGAPAIPRKPDEELGLMSRAYELSGGNSAQYHAWHADWLGTKGCFSDRFQSEIDRFILLYARDELKSESSQQAWNQQRELLLSHLSEYLLEAYRAEKPLDPVAARARKVT